MSNTMLGGGHRDPRPVRRRRVKFTRQGHRITLVRESRRRWRSYIAGPAETGGLSMSSRARPLLATARDAVREIPGATLTPSWFSWRPYVAYFALLTIYIGLNAAGNLHRKGEIWHVTWIMLLVTAIGLPTIAAGSWLFSRWLCWMYGNRS